MLSFIGWNGAGRKLNIGNVAEAKKAFTVGVALDPKNREAMHNLDVIEKLIKQHNNPDTPRHSQP